MAKRGWADLYDWNVDRICDTPIFRQIYQQIRIAILTHVLAPGTKLPSTRDLALRLSVARSSVVGAYEQLLAEGYVFGKIGSGTFVSSDLPELLEKRQTRRPARAATNVRLTLPRRLIDDDRAVSMAQSDERPFDLGCMFVDARTTQIWRQLTSRTLRRFSSTHLGYSDPNGLVELRTAICEYLKAARAVRCEPEQIIVTTGTQQVIDIAIRALLKPNDEVWIEDPGYPLTTRALTASGVRPRFVAVDAHGMNIAQGIRSAPKARAAIVTPSHQYPTGVVLSMARRLQLLSWAREAGAWLIEDDYANEFRYSGRPLASLQGLDDSERVIYCGTLNKTLFPGLRIGYAVVPYPLLKLFSRTRFLIDRQPASINQAVLVEFMNEGHLSSHIRRTRALYREQRDTLAEVLLRRAGSTLMLDIPDQGMHLNAYLPDGLSDKTLEDVARGAGVVVRAMSRFYRNAKPKQALMLGFAGYSRRSIVPAATRLAELIVQYSRHRKTA